MTAECKRLNGRAIPFGKTIPLKDGLCEMIESVAFDRFLASPENDVTLLAGGHEGTQIASTANGSLRLFADPFGLNFYADIEAGYGHKNWHLIRAMRRPANSLLGMPRRMDQCSVLLCPISTVSGLYLGARRERVLRARIEHICITERAAYGAATGAWICGDEEDAVAPLRIQEMAAEFQDGISVSPAREFIRRRG
jgi:hypothetical protein